MKNDDLDNFEFDSEEIAEGDASDVQMKQGSDPLKQKDPRRLIEKKLELQRLRNEVIDFDLPEDDVLLDPFSDEV